MAYTEFELIQTFFKQNFEMPGVVEGIGDDCALLKPNPDELLCVTTDTLISGVHFFNDANPSDIGYKSLAVSVSDLAAMGATPLWFTLALTLPSSDEDFLRSLSHGLFEAAREYNIALVGGDTTKGELSLTITAMGSVPPNQALKRNGAMVGDAIYVTGHLGEAFVGLQNALGHWELSLEQQRLAAFRLNRPSARVAIGKALLNKASSAIDISDGLLADLNHILTSSSIGAIIDTDLLPISKVFDNAPKDKIMDAILRGGDDYELCFTISPLFEQELQKLSQTCQCPITRIGKIVEKKGITIYGMSDVKVQELISTGFKHF